MSFVDEPERADVSVSGNTNKKGYLVLILDIYIIVNNLLTKTHLILHRILPLNRISTKYYLGEIRLQIQGDLHTFVVL